MDSSERRPGFLLTRKNSKGETGLLPDRSDKGASVLGLAQDPGPHGNNLFHPLPFQELGKGTKGLQGSFYGDFVEPLSGEKISPQAGDNTLHPQRLEGLIR
jgi:hypothetical protein